MYGSFISTVYIRKVVFSGLDGIYTETERLPLKAMISIIPMPMIFVLTHSVYIEVVFLFKKTSNQMLSSK